MKLVTIGGITVEEHDVHADNFYLTAGQVLTINAGDTSLRRVRKLIFNYMKHTYRNSMYIASFT